MSDGLPDLGRMTKREFSDWLGGTFDQWFRQVNSAVIQRIGVGVTDLADQPWRDWYDDGLTPADAAREALRQEGCE